MKTITLSDIKKELGVLEPTDLMQLCLKLAKYKKENKEFLGYLLFEAENEQSFIEKVKAEVDEKFLEINSNSSYFAKKGLRKILRIINKHIKFSNEKTTEIQLLLYFCEKMKDSNINFKSSTQLNNMYQAQVVKIHKAIETLHEDLQLDYKIELKKLF